jgi:hypothetical protein
MLIRSRAGAAVARPVDLRYATLSRPTRGPLAPQKRVAGIAARGTPRAASRPTAAGVSARPVTAPGPVTFFAAPRETPPAPPVVAAARPPVVAVTPPKPEEPAEPIGLRALLGF